MRRGGGHQSEVAENVRTLVTIPDARAMPSKGVGMVPLRSGHSAQSWLSECHWVEVAVEVAVGWRGARGGVRG